MWKIVLNIFLIVFLVVFQVGFLSSLAQPFDNFNLILGLLLFMSVILDFKLALWYALGTGILLEIFSIYPYGLILISTVLTVILINWLFNHFFTNRSYYSLILLGLIGFIFYYFLISGFSYLLYILKLGAVNAELTRHYFVNFLWQIILNFIWLTVAWLVLNFFGRKLKITFLVEK